jgi:cytochrome P450
MHKKYGPVVRINPDEIHFNDPDFLDALYPGPGRKTGKPKFVGVRSGTPHSIVATVDHDMHRRRRNAIAPFFSGASIRRLEPIMKEYMAKILSRMEQSGKRSEVVELHRVFKACTSDLITIYAFGDSFNFIDEKEYGKSYFDAVDGFFGLTHIFGNFPWFATLVRSVPAWVFNGVFPSMREVSEKQEWWIKKVHEIRSSNDPERIKNTIFGGILNSSLPEEEKTDERLASEAQLVIFAGEGTTAYTLTSAVYQLLANPGELQKLKDELHAAIPVGERGEIPAFSQVDGLPYFNAVIQEVIRLHPGTMNRQVRVFPDPIVYHDKRTDQEYVLHPGTVTSISPLITHMNPDVFEDPYEFRPQRWIDNPKLSRAFMGFSRGTRSCVGMTLARREMAIVLASLFLKYDVYRGQKGPTLELYDTIRARDIDANLDYIIPLPAKGSLGLRVRIRN